MSSRTGRGSPYRSGTPRSDSPGGSTPWRYLGGADPRLRLLYKGAEADVYLGVWHGRRAVFKQRKRMEYRLPELDLAIRAQRTAREAEMIHRAKLAGVRSPRLYFVDTRGFTLVMEFVEGPRLKDEATRLERDEAERLFEELGAAAARLHSAGIMHGDLTTSNVVVSGGTLALLDFGLAAHTFRVEDRAVDLRLIKETVNGAHPELGASAMKSLLRGYASVSGERSLAGVLRQLRDIERRGRYARVE